MKTLLKLTPLLLVIATVGCTSESEFTIAGPDAAIQQEPPSYDAARLDTLRDDRDILRLSPPTEDFLEESERLSEDPQIRKPCADLGGNSLRVCLLTQSLVPGLLSYHQTIPPPNSPEKYLIVIDSNVDDHGSRILHLSRTIADKRILYKGTFNPQGDLVSGDGTLYIGDTFTLGEIRSRFLTAERNDIVSISAIPILRVIESGHLTDTGALLVLPTGNRGREQPEQSCILTDDADDDLTCEPEDFDSLVELGGTGFVLLVTGYDSRVFRPFYSENGEFSEWRRDGETPVSKEELRLASRASQCGVAQEFCIAAPFYASIDIEEGIEEGEGTPGRSTFPGTSGATIIVSTTLALVKEQWPILEARELRDIALSCAIDAGPDPDGDGINETFGQGILSIICLFQPIEGLEIASREVRGRASLPGLSPASRLTGYDAYERDFAFTFAQEFRQASRVLPGGEKVAALVSHGRSVSYSFKERDLFQPTEETLQTGFIVGGETVKSFIQASDGDFPVMVGMTQSLGTGVSSWMSYGIERGFFGGSGTGSFKFAESQHVQGGLTAGYAVSEGLTLKSWGLIDYGWTKGGSSESLIESLRGYEVRGGLEALYQDGGMRVSFQAVGSSGVQGTLRFEDDVGTFPLRGSPEVALSLKWAYTF